MKLLLNNCKTQVYQLTEVLTDSQKLQPYLKIVPQLASQKDRLKKLCLYSAQRHRLLLHHNLQYYGISRFRILCVTICLVANHQLHFEVNTDTSHGLHVWKLGKMPWTQFRPSNTSHTNLPTSKYSILGYKWTSTEAKKAEHQLFSTK